MADMYRGLIGKAQVTMSYSVGQQEELTIQFQHEMCQTKRPRKGQSIGYAPSEGKVRAASQVGYLSKERLLGL